MWLMIVLSLINFCFWAHRGCMNVPIPCNSKSPSQSQEVDCNENELNMMRDGGSGEWNKREIPFCTHNNVGDSTASFSSSSTFRSLDDLQNAFEFVPSRSIAEYKRHNLASIRLPDQVATFINLNYNQQRICERYVNPYVAQKGGEYCIAIASVKDNLATYHTLRYKFPDKKDSSPGKKKHVKRLALDRPSGFFKTVANNVDRMHLHDKVSSFFSHMKELETLTLRILSNHKFYPHRNMDIVVMTVNDGEMDLLSNFVCSCAKQSISTNNILVFSSSPRILSSLQQMGLMSIYQKQFMKVSEHASGQYLDKIFVDMMWYKTFSVYLLLRLGFNVLFQDVDLVWFKDPLQYLKDSSQAYQWKRRIKTSLTFGINNEVTLDKTEIISNEINAYFSDDGQRGLRYAPLYANSGFYYLISNHATEYFGYSMLTAFDMIHLGGSHQNVFTYRLLETMDLGNNKENSCLVPKLLDIDLFPTGVKYHRDHPYMLGIKEGYNQPYNFHMCWTANKKNKIDYFKNVDMWYVSEQCSANVFALQSPKGKIYRAVLQEGRDIQHGDYRKAFQVVCCNISHNHHH